jgi:hypothetical protein
MRPLWRVAAVGVDMAVPAGMEGLPGAAGSAVMVAFSLRPVIPAFAAADSPSVLRA